MMNLGRVGGVNFLALSTTQHRIAYAADPNGKAQ